MKASTIYPEAREIIKEGPKDYDERAKSDYARYIEEAVSNFDLKDIAYIGKGFLEKTILKVKYALGITNPLKEMEKIGDMFEKRIDEDGETIRKLDYQIEDIDRLIYGKDGEGNIIEQYPQIWMLKNAELLFEGYERRIDQEKRLDNKFKEREVKDLTDRLGTIAGKYNLYFDNIQRAEGFKAMIEKQKEQVFMDKAELEGLVYDFKFFLDLGDLTGSKSLSITRIILGNYTESHNYDSLVKGLEKISKGFCETELTDPVDVFIKKKDRRYANPDAKLKKDPQEQIKLAKQRIKQDKESIQNTIESYNSSDNEKTVHLGLKIKELNDRMESEQDTDKKSDLYVNIKYLIK